MVARVQVNWGEVPGWPHEDRVFVTGANATAISEGDAHSVKRFSTSSVTVVLLVLVGLALHASSLNNTALLKHVPDPYRDPPANCTLTMNTHLFTKLFTGEALLATHGEYRPMSLATLALVRSVVPLDGPLGWHLFLLCFCIGTAGFIAAIVGRFLSWPAIGACFGLAFLLHPVTVLLVNDPGSFHVSLGMLLASISVWASLPSHGKSSPTWILVSWVAFALALLSFRHALLVPSLIVLCAVLSPRHPRSTVACLCFVCVCMAILTMLGINAAVTTAFFFIGSLMIPVVGTGLRVSPKKLSGLVIPYLLIAVAYYAVCASVKMRPALAASLRHLESDSLMHAVQTWFVCRVAFFEKGPDLLAWGLLLLLPALLLFSRRVFYLSLVPVAVIFLCLSMVRSHQYENDVVYWETLHLARPSDSSIPLHLATALIDQGKYTPAKDLLMHMLLCGKQTDGAFRATAEARLAQLYARTGNAKLAGYYFGRLSRMSWDFTIMKNLVDPAARFYFEAGYLDTAEYYWASSLVLDPYDQRTYLNLGKVLVYRNFFKAAVRYFEHVLELDPENAEALYYLAFIASLSNDTQAVEHLRARWQTSQGTTETLDFSPIWEGFEFDREHMQGILGDNPAEMLVNLRTDYRATFRGKDYSFWEAPFDIAEYCIRVGARQTAVEYCARVSARQTAVEYLIKARNASRDLEEVQQMLNEALFKVGGKTS